MDIINGVIQTIVGVFSATWWIILPVALFFILVESWLVYIHDRFSKSIKWTIIEIKVPQGILTTPKAMEQVFAAMYANYSHGFDFWQYYLDGAIDYWYSFEIVGDAKGIRFYVYTPEKMRNMVESAIYSQYPGAEINEVEDYVSTLPRTLPNRSYNLWGTNLVLAKDSCYPIRTYHYFEEVQEEKRLDPMSALLEVMSNLKGEERIWWQVVVCPSDNSNHIRNDWKQKGEAVIDKIVGKKKDQPKGFGAAIAEFMRNFVWAPIEPPVWGEAKEEKAAMMKFLNPAEQEVVKAIDTKISQLGFEFTVRFLYIDRADVFSSANVSAIMGTIRQFNTQNLNQLKPGHEKTLLSGWKPRFLPLYEKLKMFSVKKKIFGAYKARKLGPRFVGKYRPSAAPVQTFNAEELATIYHYPIETVGAPKLRRIESKRGTPPMSLPIAGEAE